MAERTLQALLLAANLDDAELVSRELVRIDAAVVIERVESEDALARALTGFPADLVIADRPFWRNEGWKTYSAVRTRRPSAPIILLAETLDEELAVTLLQGGPDDLVLKSNISRLPSVIERTLEARSPLAKLSRRQLEVLQLVVDGRSTRVIAGQLGLSVKTVESHRSSMMKRLNIHDIVGLVKFAVRMGFGVRDIQ
jgi:DNA-binding NarL/FixJ family response regulator